MNKKRLSLMPAVALAAAAMLIPASPAAAAAKPSADIVGTVVMAPGGQSATVSARYVCTQPTHLWVSAKQMADGAQNPLLTGEGSSHYADAWLQSHPLTLNCDGRNHVQDFSVGKWEYGFGALIKGQAWVQFCMTTGDEELVAYPSRWAAVR